jgi:hypothetical protein
MASEEGQQVYRRRKLTERAHGIIKNRGMTRFLVHGREKVWAVWLLQALALNLSWADTCAAALPRRWQWRYRRPHDRNRTPEMRPPHERRLPQWHSRRHRSRAPSPTAASVPAPAKRRS